MSEPTTKVDNLLKEVANCEGAFCDCPIGRAYSETAIHDIVKATVESLLEIAK